MNRFLVLGLFIVCFAGTSATLTQRDIVTNKLINEFAKSKRAEGLTTSGFGGSQKDGKNTLIAVTFRVEEVMSIDSARKLIVKSVSDFLDLINSKPDFQQYLLEYPCTAKCIEIGIIGNNPKSSHESYIKSVLALRGEIYYYTEADTYSPLITVHEETFENACAIVNAEPCRH